MDKNRYEVDFSEKSTRMATIVAAISGVVFYFLYKSERIWNLSSDADGFLPSIFISILFSAVIFIFSLILIREKNYSVFLAFPIWFFTSKMMVTDRWGLDFGEILFNFIGSFFIVMVILLVLGTAVEWVKQGR